MEGETKRKQGFLCRGELFGLNLTRGLELACQRRSESLPPESNAGNNLRNIFTERRSLLQGFPSPKFCVLWNTVPFWVNHPQLHLLRLLRRKNNSIQNSSPMWGDMGGGPRSRALFPSFRNKGSNFAPVSRNVTWAISLSPHPPSPPSIRQLYPFSCKIKRRGSGGGNQVSFSERQKGNLGQRKLFNFFGLLKLLTGGRTDVNT